MFASLVNCASVNAEDSASYKALICAPVWSAVAAVSIPSNLLPSVAISLPSTVPPTVILPVVVTVAPSRFALIVPVVIVKLPVEAPVNEPVPTTNLSSLSSNPIKALSDEPRSNTKPISPAGVPLCPFASSINLSVMTVFVEAAVVVVPLTVKLPATTTSSNVTSASVATDCPIDIAPFEIATPVPAV